MPSQTDRELFDRARTLAPIAAILPHAANIQADVYLVGGTIRDLLLDRAFVDVDLAVDGDPLRLAAAIGAPAAGESRFGTLSVTRDGIRYDLARTRSERYPRPGALPEVAPGGIEEDLTRRDFTANAIALGLAGARAGELIAAPGALEDLERRTLAVLHDGSFEDDPTRLLRLARYAARLDFDVAPHTRELARAAIANHALDTVSGTRIGNELRLLATEPDPLAAFQAAHDLGLPWAIDPEPTRSALEVLPDDGRADLLVLACVLGSQPGEGLVPELDRLGFTAPDRDAIAQAATQARTLAKRLANTTSRSGIAREVGAAGIETVALAFSQGAPSQSLTWLQDLRHLELAISGDDLKANGIPEGPAVGQGLRAAKDALLDGIANDRDAQLQVALKAAE